MNLTIFDTAAVVSVSFQTRKAPCLQCELRDGETCLKAHAPINAELIQKCEEEQWRPEK